MKELPAKIFDIKPGSVEYILALKEQINRDLSKVGNYEFITENSFPKDWINLFSEIIKKLTENELNQLLYVVDLPENWSEDLRQSESPYVSLAEAILQREWQKVYFRKMFS